MVRDGGGRPRILVADDDVIFRSVCTAKLKPVGDLIEAGDGIEAWHQIKAGGLALALIDIDMPHMSGLALVQCIRGHLPTKHLPIVMITSHDDVATLRATLQAGATSYLTKPVNWSLFADHIAHLLALGETRQSFEVERARMKAEQAARRLLEELYGRELERAVAGAAVCVRRHAHLGRIGAVIARSGEEAVELLEPSALLHQAMADASAGGVAMGREAGEADGRRLVVQGTAAGFGALLAEMVDAAVLMSAGGAAVRCGVTVEDGANDGSVSLWVRASGSVGDAFDDISFALGSIGILAALNGGEATCETGPGGSFGVAVRLAAFDAVTNGRASAA